MSARWIAWLLVSGFATVAGVAHAAAPAGLPKDSIEGLWTGVVEARAAGHDTLEIARGAHGLSAIVGGQRISCTSRGDSIGFALPGGHGSYRGHWTKDRAGIEGFWIQPFGPLYDAGDPGAQSFATPVRLRASGVGVWRGDVTLHADRLCFGLRVERAADGAVFGALRTLETNGRGGASRFQVRSDSDSLWLTARPDSTQPEIRIPAARLRAPDRLRLVWPELGVAVELHRPSSAEAAAFIPRVPADTAYAYQMPLKTGDGWRVARARDAGLDEAALARIVQALARGDAFARRPSLVHSLLVAHAGSLVLDEYFYGWSRERPHDLRSAGKTFSSVLLGAEMRRGVPLSPESRLLESLRNQGPFANPDPRKERITLDHLMSHRSGLAADDNDDDSPGSEDRMQSQRAQLYWWRYELDLPMKYEPGQHYAYASGAINLVGAALASATHGWLPALIERDLARPLQFGLYHWNLMPSGEAYLGGGAAVRPRDLLKLGQLYLDHGIWNGRRVVDSSWVAISTSPVVDISPATTGLDSTTFGNYYLPGSDGYAWHCHTLASRGRPYREFEATGNGGQLLIVVPELDLAVVITGGNFGQGGIWTRWRNEIVADQIIPAVEAR